MSFESPQVSSCEDSEITHERFFREGCACHRRPLWFYQQARQVAANAIQLYTLFFIKKNLPFLSQVIPEIRLPQLLAFACGR